MVNLWGGALVLRWQDFLIVRLGKLLTALLGGKNGNGFGPIGKIKAHSIGVGEVQHLSCHFNGYVGGQVSFGMEY
ncbi:hypothetical protein [Pelagibacterium sp.]